MEYDKINNLLSSLKLSEDNKSEQLSKFVTREYVKVNSLLDTYNENKSIRFKTPMLRSNLCDYSDAYILVKGTITIMAPGVNNNANNIRDKRNRPVILKNNAPFVSCITRINGELIEDSDELTNDENKNFANIDVINSNAFKYKNKIIDNTYNVAAGVEGYDVNENGT